MWPARKEGKCAPPKSALCTRIPAGEASPASRHAPAPPSLPPFGSSPRPKTWHADAMFTGGHGVDMGVRVCLLQYLLQSCSRVGGGNNGAHVLRETTSRGLCGKSAHLTLVKAGERPMCNGERIAVVAAHDWSSCESGVQTFQTGEKHGPENDRCPPNRNSGAHSKCRAAKRRRV